MLFTVFSDFVCINLIGDSKLSINLLILRVVAQGNPQDYRYTISSTSVATLQHISLIFPVWSLLSTQCLLGYWWINGWIQQSKCNKVSTPWVIKSCHIMQVSEKLLYASVCQVWCWTVVHYHIIKAFSILSPAWPITLSYMYTPRENYQENRL